MATPIVSLAKFLKVPSPPRAPKPLPAKSSLYWLFGSTLFVLIPHLTHHPLWLGSLCVLIIFWRLFSLNRGLKDTGWLVNGILALLLVALVLLQYQTIFGRLAGSALLVTFAAMKTMETTTLRDAMFSAILLIVLVMTNFLFDQSPFAAIYGLAGIILIVGNLNMLVAPLSLNMRQALKFTLRILLHGIPLALIAYLLFPRIEGSLWGLAEDPHSAVTGLSDTVSPGSFSSLSENNDVAFRVEFSGRAPKPEDLYWRTIVLDLTDGKTWHQGPKTEDKNAPQLRQGGTLQIYDITLEPTEQHWIPVLETAYETNTRAGINNNGVIINKHPIKQRIRYQGVSLLNTPMLSGEPRNYSTQLYPSIKPRVLEFATQLRQQYKTPIKIAQAMLTHFNQREYYYSLTPPLLGSNPVDEFLFDTRNGYCEHYASAFSVVMRAAGIPSRVIVGYQGSEPSSDGTYHIVRQSNAHAWSEIWVAGQGWIRVDPTAAIAPERIEQGMSSWVDSLRPDRETDSFREGDRSATVREVFTLDFMEFMIAKIKLSADVFTHRWNQWILSYGPEQQRDLLRQFGFKTPDWGLMLLSLFFLSMIFALVTYYFLSLPGKSAETPVKYFRIFKQKLTKAGVTLAPWQGPVSTIEQANKQLPDHIPEINEIGQLYTTLQYGQGIEKQLFEQLKEKVKSLKLEKSI